MLLKEVIGFNKDLFFDGAVNVKWLYDDIDRFKKAANSFVFHNDVYLKDKKQTSTIGFLKELYNVVNDDTGELNNLIMGIAPYGAGKSHLITSFYTLFSNNSNIISNDIVLKNVAEHDEDFANSYQKNITKPNIVLVLNGMEDFDLSVEIDKQIRFILEKSDINTDIFDNNEPLYNGMKDFIDVTYDTEKFKHFLKESTDTSINISKESLKNNLDKDVAVFNFVNKASIYVLSREFKIIEYLNPKSLLESICEKLCGDGNPFGKVVILFDEIGRYIHWMSGSNVNNSAIQQLFEGVQTFSNKVTFISFSQKSLDSYYNDLLRSKIDTITRYIDRFKSSKKYYLSNILEMVFSRLVIIEKHYETSNKNHCDYATLLSWIPNVKDKYIWSSRDAYEHYIIEKLAFFHPLTIYSLVTLSEFTQKRSAINVLHTLIRNFEETDLRNFDVIRACDLFDTGIIEDIMGNDSFNNYASGLLQKYTTVVNRVHSSINLKAIDKKVLQAITLIGILSFKTKSYEDYQNLIIQISGSILKEVSESLSRMQEEFGIIVYSEEKYNHYIDENSSSREDLLKFVKLKKQENRAEWINENNFINSLIEKYGGNEFENIPCSIKRSVNTREWYFSQIFIHCDSFTKHFISAGKNELEKNKEIKHPRSKVYWIYYNNKAKHNIDKYIEEIKKNHHELRLNKIPYYTFLIYDENFTLIDKGMELLVLENLSDSDKAKFSKFITSVKKTTSDDFVNELITLKSNGWFIDSNGYNKYADYKRYLNDKIEILYPDIIPIRYESMDNKTLTGIKDYLRLAMELSTNSLDKNEIIKRLTPQLKQRFDIVFDKYGWNIFDEKEQMKSEFEEPLKKMIDILDEKLLHNNREYKVYDIFDFFYAPPYGINIYTFLFIIGLYFKINSQKYLFEYNNIEYYFHDWFPIVCEDNRSVESVLEDSVVKINRDPGVHKLVENLLVMKDVKEFMSSISQRLLDKIENIDSQKASLINEKWQVAKNLNKLLESLRDYKNELSDKNTYLKPTVIMDIITDVSDLQNQFYELDKKFKSYFREYLDNEDVQYKEMLTKVFQYIELAINVWDENTKEESLSDIESKLNNINLIKEHFQKYEKTKFSNILGSKNQQLTNIRLRFAEFSEHVIIHNNIPVIAKHSELLTKKQGLQRLSDKIMNDNILTTSLKYELTKKINEITNKINNKVDSDNTKIEVFLNKIYNVELDNLKAISSLRNDVFELLNIVDSKHKSYATLSNIIDEIDKIIQNIKDIRNREMTIDEIKDQLNLITSNINENLNIVKLVKIEEKTLINNILDKNKRFVKEIEKLSQNPNLDSQATAQLISKIENKPIYLQQQDITYIEKIKNELIITGNKFIGKQIISLFSKISDNSYKENLLEKLLNEITS